MAYGSSHHPATAKSPSHEHHPDIGLISCLGMSIYKQHIKLEVDEASLAK
jgi:hypothetical protein